MALYGICKYSHTENIYIRYVSTNNEKKSSPCGLAVVCYCVL